MSVKQMEIDELYKTVLRKEKVIEQLTETIKMLNEQINASEHQLAEYRKVIKLRSQRR